MTKVYVKVMRMYLGGGKLRLLIYSGCGYVPNNEVLFVQKSKGELKSAKTKSKKNMTK